MSNFLLSPETLPAFIDMFRSYLAVRKLTALQISIYSALLSGFLLETDDDSLENLQAYAQRTGVSREEASAAASLWKEFFETKTSGIPTDRQEKYRSFPSSEELLAKYVLALEASQRSQSTIKNYTGDLRAFIDFFGESDIRNFLTKPNVLLYIESLKNGELSAA